MKNINLDVPAKSDGTTIRQHTADLLDNADLLLKLGYIHESEYSLLRLACEYHDYGKINEDFQKRLATNSKFDENVEIPHNVLSAFFIDKNLISDDGKFAIIFNAVLNHHFYSDNMDYINFKMNKIKDKLKDYDLNYKVKRAIKDLDIVRISKTGILIKGLLHKCDYSASAGIQIEHPNDFLVNSMEHLLEKWRKSGISTSYNEMQLFCQQNSDDNIVITAPTGMGKTEASLLWLGNSKGFYILPIRTAINCIYERISKDILENQNINKRVSLLHSSNMAFLMEKYQNMDLFEYLSFSKNLTLPLTVSTPDQLFNFVFMPKGYELKLSVLSYSKIILDEIQAYSPELLAYIIYGIHKIVDIGGKFAIFTATLPPFIVDLLNFSKKMPYIQKNFTHNQLRHNVKIINREIDIDYICDTFCENEKNDSNKTLIVCNTVKKAQNIFTELKKMLPDTKICLLHSKFTQNDRARLEEQILADGDTKIKKSVIWITTQVVEASVDIDFDCIFTELMDLNSLFQRLGRCNRKGIKDISSYNSYVFTKIDNSLIINKQTNHGFIDGEIYNLSKRAIENIDGILDETTKNNLLNEFFTFENMKDSDFISDFEYHYNYLKDLFLEEASASEIDQKFRNILSFPVLPQSLYEENKDKIMQNIDILHEKYNEIENKDDFLLKKEHAKNIIHGFCVSVHPKNISKIIKTLKVGSYEVLRVVDCEYYWLEYGIFVICNLN